MDQEKDKFAKVTWCVDDILSIRPKWTKEEALLFLEANESDIIDSMVDAGWDAIESIID